MKRKELLNRILESANSFPSLLIFLEETSILFIYSGLIISGGENRAGLSAEVFVPSTGKHCQLPDMPGQSRAFHTMEKMMMCGGSQTAKSCLTLIDGIWKETTTLLVDRYNLTCPGIVIHYNGSI